MRRMIQVLEAAVDAPTETHVLMYWALEELIYLKRASRANRNRAFFADGSLDCAEHRLAVAGLSEKAFAENESWTSQRATQPSR